jgi:hypothetical protein
MALYTIVVEHNGGTYISQFRASARDQLSEQMVSVIRPALKVDSRDLQDALRDQRFLEVENCVNVWCMTGLLGDKLLLINLIRTSDEKTSPGKPGC